MKLLQAVMKSKPVKGVKHLCVSGALHTLMSVYHKPLYCIIIVISGYYWYNDLFVHMIALCFFSLCFYG